MSEKPILFSTEMVNAILEGRKTQTRRVIKPQPVFNPEFPPKTWIYDPDGKPDTALAWRTPDNLCGVAFSGKGIPGDTLWVRETWATLAQYDTFKPSGLPNVVPIYYEASRTFLPFTTISARIKGKTRPSIYMPRWASRITLTITGVRVERLQQISETDAEAEGVELGVMDTGLDYVPSYVAEYAELWDTINGKTHPWHANPWVWVIEFEVMK